MAVGRLSSPTIDANDPERLASFWSALLEVEGLDEATEAIRGLRGSWDGNVFTFDEARWRTLTDPEGNEFDIYVSGA